MLDVVSMDVIEVIAVSEAERWAFSGLGENEVENRVATIAPVAPRRSRHPWLCQCKLCTLSFSLGVILLNLALIINNHSILLHSVLKKSLAATWLPPFADENKTLWICGWNHSTLARHVFPDFGAPLQYNPNITSHKKDILLFGLHGPCDALPSSDNETARIELIRQSFAGKMLVINGEPFGDDMTQMGLYQIGSIADSPRSILLYFFVFPFLARPESWHKILHVRNKPINTQKYNAVSYVARNCQDHREKAVLEIAKILPVHYTRCRGTESLIPNITKAPDPLPATWKENDEFYHNYKFCLVMENSKLDFYITEKILLAFLGGCLPVYYGTEEVFDVFNRHAFIYYNVSDSLAARQELAYLVKNETAYNEMLQLQPILAHGKKTLQDYFSVSDKIGDGILKRKIRKMMNLPWTT